MQNKLKQMSILIGCMLLVANTDCRAYKKVSYYYDNPHSYTIKKNKKDFAEIVATIAVLGTLTYLGMWALAYSPAVPRTRHTVYKTTDTLFGPVNTVETYEGDYGYTPLQQLARWYFRGL